MKTLRLLATLAALTLTASTTRAAVLDLSNVLGPSGRYTSQEYYQIMLGGQPMTSAQQAYSDQQDQLRLLGYLSEARGDFALGQIFYHIAYGINPPSPLSGLDLASGLGAGASDASDSSSFTDSGSVLTLGNSTGDGLPPSIIAAPEASGWVMMLLGFAGLGFMGWRTARKTA